MTAAGQATTRVKLTDISYQVNKQNILKGIDLTVSTENYILMTGQNGSGKSTLLKIISGLLKPDSGNISTHADIDNFRSWSAAKTILRQHFCYLHQIPYLFAGSVYDNIAYGLKRMNMNRDAIDARVNEALQVVDLHALSQRNSHALSGGEKQRVAIARSWVIRPDFMLLDEPFANMDKHSRSETYSIINQLKENNIGIIITSHDPHHGELNFNRHLHLYQGQMSEKDIT